MFSRPWFVLVSLLSITVFYQNCGSPAGGGDQAASTQASLSVAPDQSAAIEVVSYLTLTGIDWVNMTDEDVIREVIEQLENVATGLPVGSATRTRIEALLELLRGSAEFRALVVSAVRETAARSPAATPTPTPAAGATGPNCNLDVRPYVVDRSVANSLKFTWTSQDAKYAAFKYWDGANQLSQNVGVDGSLTLSLRANFSARPDILPFNVMVVSAGGIVGKCTIFVEFK